MNKELESGQADLLVFLKTDVEVLLREIDAQSDGSAITQDMLIKLGDDIKSIFKEYIARGLICESMQDRINGIYCEIDGSCLKILTPKDSGELFTL